MTIALVAAVSLVMALTMYLALSWRSSRSTSAERGQSDLRDQALRCSDERYRAVVESIRDYAIFTTDPDGVIVDWYPGAASVFGWPADEIRGKPVDVLFVPEDRAAGAPSLELATAAAKGVAPDVRWHLRQDGTRVFIEGKVVPISGSDGLDGFLKIGQDMTDRRRSERALRRSEERFGRFGEASSDVLWVCDARTLRVEYASRAVEAIYGIDRGETGTSAVGRRWLRSIHRADRRAVLDALRALRAGQRQSFEFRIVQAGGAERWIRTTAFPLLNEAAEVRQLGGIDADITGEKNVAHRLEVLVGELQHRTRNVVAVVQALADSTARETNSVADFQTAFAARLAAVSRVQGLLSRMTEGEKVAFDVLLESELAAHGFPDGAAQRRQRVTLEGPRNIALRSRNIQTFALALHELATNAVKYGALAAAGGHLSVRWWLQAGAAVPALHVEWRETGVRVAPDQAGRQGYGRKLIEQALPYQLDATTTYRLGDDGVHCAIAVPLSEA